MFASSMRFRRAVLALGLALLLINLVLCALVGWQDYHDAPTAAGPARLTIGLMLAVLLGGMMLVALRSQRLAENAHAELRKVVDGLEQRVRERTAELDDARRAADRANDAKSRFLAAASHDLRQPFQAMRLFLDVLLQRADDPRNQLVLARLDEAFQAGEALLIALLDISTLEAGTVKVAPIPVALDQVLHGLAADAAPLAAQKGLGFRWVPCRRVVKTDPVLLQRMVRNLLSNALRYTDRGGVLLGCRRRGGRLVIEVWDSGIGIPPDSLDAVFEDFARLESGGREHGMGLGLSVVRRTAGLLGCAVSVRSTVGKGTVFALTLPADGLTAAPRRAP